MHFSCPSFLDATRTPQGHCAFASTWSPVGWAPKGVISSPLPLLHLHLYLKCFISQAGNTWSSIHFTTTSSKYYFKFKILLQYVSWFAQSSYFVGKWDYWGHSMEVEAASKLGHQQGCSARGGCRRRSSSWSRLAEKTPRLLCRVCVSQVINRPPGCPPATSTAVALGDWVN